MRVAAFTPGRTVPSARFRVRQFIPHLRALGIQLEEMSTTTEAYPPAVRWRRPLWGARRLVEIAPLVVRSRSCDRVILQREMISTMVTLEPFTGRPRLLDVDDSVHLHHGGVAARRLAQLCDRVIAGNNYLAEIYRRWNSDVVVLPTAIDSDVFVPGPSARTEEEIVIGWIGTSANHRYLTGIEPPLAAALMARPSLRLRVISDRAPDFAIIDPDRWSFAKWREDTEVAEVQAMNIGIMPLEDSEWARGKCSFKMLQYMACGLPVVVSPVGNNHEVLREALLGVAAAEPGEWIEALLALADSPGLRAKMGAAGRSVIERLYATKVIAPRLAKYLA